MDATADATEKPAGTPLAVAPAVAVASAVASNPFAGAGATATAPAGLYPSVGPPTPTPGTPYVVANPLQLAVGAPGTPVLVSAASSFALSPGGGGLASPGGDRRASLGASGLGILHQGSRFTKTTLYGCLPVGHDELLAAPGHVVADRTGCCCNFSRSVVAARDVAAWVTEKSTCCGGGYSCCPASARVEVHPTGDRAGVVHVAVEARDADLAGPLNAAMRATLNADRSTPIIVNDGGKSFAASTCVCCVFQASNKLSLGGAGAYDLTAVHVQTGCFAMHQRLEGSSVADVAYAQYTNSIGACACVQSHLGGCHCGEQLVLGLKNHHTLLTVTTNKGQAKEAVTDMFRRTRHPMMPEPAVVRVVKGSTVCCGPESELSIGTEALTLSLFRFPTGCFCFAPCQAASNTSVPLDDVTLVGVMEESPCENASRAAASIPAHFGAMLSAVLYLNIIGFMLNLLNFVIGFPLILYESVAGLVCLPCRRSFVTVVGPADIAFRVRPPLDTGRSISDFAVELHQQIRELQTARRDMLAAILAGAGKDAVLFAAAPRAVDPTALPP